MGFIGRVKCPRKMAFSLGGLVNITQTNASAEFTAKDPLKEGRWLMHVWLQGK